MDEILIGEKKYVSSKLAAKATGYAKDYVGQLCREGRVPARLVGRSWYVLESAIQDHRFGDQKTEEVANTAASSTSVFPQTWESPRYEASSTETLPSVNRLQGAGDEQDGVSEVSQRLHDSWRAWFDRIADAEAPLIPDVVPEKREDDVDEPEMIQEEMSEEISIPIHTVYHLPPKELLPHHHLESGFSSENQEEKTAQKKATRGTIMVVQAAGMLVAVCMAALAVAGSGYVDSLMLSNRQVGVIAGIGLYNK